MEREHALKVLNSLANGVSPITGEVFAADSPYQHPDVVRALFQGIRDMEGAQKAGLPSARSRSDQPLEAARNTFVRWTPEEEERLAAGFDAGRSSDELARLHNRSRAAIEARLLKLGKIDVSGLTVQLRYAPSRGA